MILRSVARLLGALLAFAICGVALAADDGERTGGGPSELGAFAAKGPIQIRDSSAGRAVVSARNLAPGQSRVGSVRIAVVGDGARVALRLRRLLSLPGPRGGVLAEALTVKVRRLNGRPRRLVFSGPASELRRIDLGRWRAGRTHHYRVRIRFPDSSVPQDAMQGAEARFTLIWGASA